MTFVDLWSKPFLILQVACSYTTVCDHGCVRLDGKDTCTCNPGYQLDSDNSTCIDLDECATNSSTCDVDRGVCTNTEGSFTCACTGGYTLGPNNECDGMSLRLYVLNLELICSQVAVSRVLICYMGAWLHHYVSRWHNIGMNILVIISLNILCNLFVNSYPVKVAPHCRGCSAYQLREI